MTAAEGGSPVSIEERERAADNRLLRGVRRRLLLVSGGATLVVLLLLGVALYTAVAQSLAASGEDQVRERANTIKAFLGNNDPSTPPYLDLTFGGGGVLGYVVYADPDGTGPDRVQGPRSIPGLPNQKSIQAARANGTDDRLFVVETSPQDLPVRIHTVAQTGLPGDPVIQVVQDRSAEQETLDVLLAVLVIGGLVAVVAGTAVGAIYARRAMAPIRTSLIGQRDALRRQREFAADASHELRTPLTIVRASVEHLQLHPERPVSEVGTALDDIDAEVTHLTSMVEDLLLLARSDSGALDLNLQPVELGDAAADAASSMAAPAAERDVHLQVDPEPVMILADPVRVRQLITILLDNAVRHSPPGGNVIVSVRRDPRGAVLEVSDQGPGIAAADLAHVFDRFWRAPGAPGGGTGLGLAIAATIVTRLGGRIGVANRPTGGAIFTVILTPLRPAPRTT